MNLPSKLNYIPREEDSYSDLYWQSRFKINEVINYLEENDKTKKIETLESLVKDLAETLLESTKLIVVLEDRVNELQQVLKLTTKGQMLLSMDVDELFDKCLNDIP